MLSPTPLKNGDRLLVGNSAAYIFVPYATDGDTSMSRTSALVGALAISILSAGPFASCAFAQVPPAGSAGAGGSAISGIPAGPANPSVLSDPSGIGNAGRMAPLGSNAPAPPTSYGSVMSSPPSPVSRSRVVPPPTYTSDSPRFSGRSVVSRRPTNQRRTRPQTSSFTGICRGC